MGTILDLLPGTALAEYLGEPPRARGGTPVVASAAPGYLSCPAGPQGQGHTREEGGKNKKGGEGGRR